MQKIYTPYKKLAQGAFGQVYLTQSIRQKQLCILKLSKIQQKNLTLNNPLIRQFKILKLLNENKIQKIPEVFNLGRYYNQVSMSMSFVGEDIYNSSKVKKYTKQEIIKLGKDIIGILQQIHKLNIIHKDIKPQNICQNQKRSNFYLIDFGVSQVKTQEQKNKLQPSRVKQFLGTYKFASIAAHKYFEQSFKQDLQSLGYTLLYLWTGTLPWMKIKQTDLKLKNKMILNMKIGLRNELENLPENLANYFSKVFSLQFNQIINYKQLTLLLQSNDLNIKNQSSKSIFSNQMNTLETRKHKFYKTLQQKYDKDNLYQQDDPNPKISTCLRLMNNMRPKFIQNLK